MKVIWLGQAGLLFEIDGRLIIIDPYLSNSVEKINPRNCRRLPIDKSFLKITPHVLAFTHNHLDHYDPQTVSHYLTDSSHLTVLAPYSVWQEVRKFGGSHNYVMFNSGTVWTEGDIVFRAVYAEHSDKDAIGIIIGVDGKNYYITGDTLYNESIFSQLPSDIEAVFLPINGVGNNMNVSDAKHFATKIGARVAVPIHFGLFDEMNGEEFAFSRRVIPRIYEEIKL